MSCAAVAGYDARPHAIQITGFALHSGEYSPIFRLAVQLLEPGFVGPAVTQLRSDLTIINTY